MKVSKPKDQTGMTSNYVVVYCIQYLSCRILQKALQKSRMAAQKKTKHMANTSSDRC